MSDFTLGQLASLNAAIAEGVLRVEYEDRVVTYRNWPEILQIRAMLRADLGLNGTGSGIVVAETSKDLS